MDWNKIVSFLTTAGVDLLRGIAVFAIGCFLVHWILKFMVRKDVFRKIDPTLKGFLMHLIRILLYIVVIFTTASTMGIQMTSILTIFASAGVAVSLALQGVLTNLLGGFILLLLKPIRVGEYVKIGENEGTVKNIGAFYTTIDTVDNRMISLPNGNLTNAPIVNFSREDTRRVDLVFSVSYESDLDQVYEVLNRVVAEQEGVLETPAPQIHLAVCADSSLDFSVWVWAHSKDFWKVKHGLLDSGKRALDQAGISIPYPQMDVHMKS